MLTFAAQAVFFVIDCVAAIKLKGRKSRRKRSRKEQETAWARLTSLAELVSLRSLHHRRRPRWRCQRKPGSKPAQPRELRRATSDLVKVNQQPSGSTSVLAERPHAWKHPRPAASLIIRQRRKRCIFSGNQQPPIHKSRSKLTCTQRSVHGVWEDLSHEVSSTETSGG